MVELVEQSRQRSMSFCSNNQWQTISFNTKTERANLVRTFVKEVASGKSVTITDTFIVKSWPSSTWPAYGQPIVSDAVHVMLGCISEINSLQTVLRDRWQKYISWIKHYHRCHARVHTSASGAADPGSLQCRRRFQSSSDLLCVCWPSRSYNVLCVCCWRFSFVG